ncbi:hypothetical protein PROFUN_11562 [Planoprotostelium fungivorum]|uniref:CN hydrolase domain-containing protein n=1 Tax=Planoprotostelium fungivorum TaxID=1890364 RepID=A0A2P6N9L1_9EUKA|nr:hypothetical protein PROFUN_11562 [Planoprotostelium fungivorum]
MVLAAVGQFRATIQVLANAESCLNIIHRASKAGAKTVFLPEASDFIGLNAEEGLKTARNETPQFVKMIRDAAALSKIEVSVGIHSPFHLNNDATVTPTKTTNTCLFISSDGEYHKLHLFDVFVEGSPIYHESKGVQKGSSFLKPFDTSIGRLGMNICYDVRFPEMALKLRREGAEILQYPSAFTLRTGAAHWELLLRARAVDTQCYVMAAAQGGKNMRRNEMTDQQVGKHDEEGRRASYGHAMIVDPWGSIVAQCSDMSTEPSFCLADVDLQSLRQVRQSMPLWDQRREDVFPS